MPRTIVKIRNVDVPEREMPMMESGKFRDAWLRFFQASADQINAMQAVSALVAAGASYANDAAAAAGGVSIGALYRNGSIVMVRVT